MKVPSPTTKTNSRQQCRRKSDNKHGDAVTTLLSKQSHAKYHEKSKVIPPTSLVCKNSFKNDKNKCSRLQQACGKKTQNDKEVNRNKSSEHLGHTKGTLTGVSFTTYKKATSNDVVSSISVLVNINKSSEKHRRRAVGKSTGVGFLTCIKSSNDVDNCKESVRTTKARSLDDVNSLISNTTTTGKLNHQSSGIAKLNENKNEKTLIKLHELENTRPSPLVSTSCTSKTRHITKVAWEDDQDTNTRQKKNECTNVSDVDAILYDDVTSKDDLIDSNDNYKSDKIEQDKLKMKDDFSNSSNDDDYDTDIEEEFPGMFNLFVILCSIH